jgi:hypothetical protein
MSTTTPVRSAFDLLSKPTLELSDDEITEICVDLRARRERFLAGQKDNIPKAAKPAANPEDKEANSAAVLGDIENLF